MLPPSTNEKYVIHYVLLSALAAREVQIQMYLKSRNALFHPLCRHLSSGLSNLSTGLLHQPPTRPPGLPPLPTPPSSRWLSGKLSKTQLWAWALAGVAQWIEHWSENQRVRAHAWVAGQVPSGGCVRGNHTLMFLSLSFSPLPLCLNINK